MSSVFVIFFPAIFKIRAVMKTLFRVALPAVLLTICLIIQACSTPQQPPPAVAATEPETLSRTEFTDRIENYFEYEPLHAGKATPFRIHLTDLSDGSPVAQAQVTLTVSTKGSPSSIV